MAVVISNSGTHRCCLLLVDELPAALARDPHGPAPSGGPAACPVTRRYMPAAQLSPRGRTTG